MLNFKKSIWIRKWKRLNNEWKPLNNVLKSKHLSKSKTYQKYYFWKLNYKKTKIAKNIPSSEKPTIKPFEIPRITSLKSTLKKA